MDDCTNVIESLVVQEVKDLSEGLSESVRNKIHLHEVSAFALNRLPPLYATSRLGWEQQRKRAATELKDTIHHHVQRAIVAVQKDTLRAPDPIAPEELMSEARALCHLRKVLNRSDLIWDEVPRAVAEALKTIRIRGTLEYSKLSSSRRSALAVQDFLKRKRSKDPNWRGKESLAYFGDSDEVKRKQEKEFSAYIESAGCDFVNALERLVLHLANQYIERLDPKVYDEINLYEVLAYTLNRLPPMYATTSRGLKQLRQRAKEDHGKAIVATIHKAVSIILHNPHRVISPLPFRRKQGDCQLAFKKLEELLQVTDIDCSNVALIVDDALDLTLSGQLDITQVQTSF